jgi:hypothetical protein
LIKSPVPTVKEVRQAGTFCINLAGCWFRAKADGPIPSDGQHEQLKVMCIDYGFNFQATDKKQEMFVLVIYSISVII